MDEPQTPDEAKRSQAIGYVEKLDRATIRRLLRVWGPILVGFCLIRWAWGEPETSGSSQAQCFVIVLGTIAAARAVQWHSSNRRRDFAIVAVIAVLWISWKVTSDFYIETWTNTFGDQVEDRFRAWGNVHIRRDVSFSDRSGSMSGPMSPSGKPHGAWVVTYLELGKPDEQIWYWYGDRISEGEWHLRNK